MTGLFDSLFGPDYCYYEYTQSKHCVLVPGQFPKFSYDHVEWEKAYDNSSSTCNNDKTNAEIKTAIPEVPAKKECIQETEGFAPIQLSFFNFGNISDLTRRQIAAVKLPKVAFIADEDVTLVPETEAATCTNDCSVGTERPSEATVKYALKLLASALPVTDNVDDSDDEDSIELNVKIGRLGTFSKSSVQMFQSMCKLSWDAGKICKEQEWLSQTSLLDLTNVKAFLLNAKPHDEVLRQGQFIMDVSDYSTLACERYLNGFTIDALCLKLLDENKPTKVVYLPTFSQMWAKQGTEYFRYKVSNFFSHCTAEDATCILPPVHFENEQHWGLLCLDASSTTVFFDDGLKISPPSEILTVIKNMLIGLKDLSGSDQYNYDNWSQCLPLPRMGMPTQPASGEGAASCGVGVILAIKDIIESGESCPIFNWCFTNMAHLRKELMILALQWKC